MTPSGTSNASVILKKNRQKSVINRHPWIFSGAIDSVDGSPKPGAIVDVFGHNNEFLASGFWNPYSQIRVRVLTHRKEVIDADFFEERLKQAVALREMLLPATTDAYRLVHSDADQLSGLVVDRYGDVLAVRYSSLGIWEMRETVIDLLQKMLKPASIIATADAKALKADGLRQTVESPVFYGDPLETIVVRENSLRFKVDLVGGQKTGFFLDQRDNRAYLETISGGTNLLNAFAYSGGFSVYAARAGATTTSVDISKAALLLAEENFRLNHIDTSPHQFTAANVFDYLREMSGDFDRIVLDPPAFAKTRGHVQKAARGYKDINRLAISKIRSNGILLTCSCSSHISNDLFRKILFSAASEAGRQVQILANPGQPLDHPVSIYHPEGEYLKTLVLRVI